MLILLTKLISFCVKGEPYDVVISLTIAHLINKSDSVYYYLLIRMSAETAQRRAMYRTVGVAFLYAQRVAQCIRISYTNICRKRGVLGNC